ncbi:putative F-box protein [Panicum miliaceum]|uniref:F-box protein n=1 Tax=Panicum miliaceum TaxID=4540 RepID=A0A3L6T2B4_PANMI|nr:putative F-box protein [Panicum miliaceum]
MEKRRRITVTAATIPDDLLVSDVLVRLPAKSLARCRCVCRSWRAGIAAAAFIRRHLELSRSRAAQHPSAVPSIPRWIHPFDGRATCEMISFHRLLLPPPGRRARAPPGIVDCHDPGSGDKVRDIDSELVLEKAWREGITRLISPTHCDGLVAIATATDRVFVCNPATGDHNAVLEHCEAEDFVPQVALGFDQWRNRYVVARYFYRTYTYGGGAAGQDHDDVGHEVFALGAGGDWELTQDPPYAVGVQRPMCTWRAFYWHADEPEPRLMRFGLQDRAFTVVPRPPTGWNPVDDMAALRDGSTLCYVHASAEASFQVWLAEDDDGRELQWSLRCRIDLLDPVPSVNYNLMPVTAADGDTLVALAGGTLWKYDMGRKQGAEEVVAEMHNVRYRRRDGSKFFMDQPFVSEHHIVPYIESLVAIA